MKTIEINGKNENVYEMSDWKGSFEDDIPLKGYVDREIAWELINCVPPHKFYRHYFQCGEPHSHVNGRATYLTMVRVTLNPEVWQFVGYLHSGEGESFAYNGASR